MRILQRITINANLGHLFNMKSQSVTLLGVMKANALHSLAYIALYMWFCRFMPKLSLIFRIFSEEDKNFVKQVLISSFSEPINQVRHLRFPFV